MVLFHSHFQSLQSFLHVVVDTKMQALTCGLACGQFPLHLVTPVQLKMVSMHQDASINMWPSLWPVSATLGYTSSGQDGIYALREAYMCSTPSLRSFPNIAFETVPMFVWPTTAILHPFKEDHLARPLSTPLSSRRSMVRCPWLRHSLGNWQIRVRGSNVSIFMNSVQECNCML